MTSQEAECSCFPGRIGSILFQLLYKHWLTNPCNTPQDKKNEAERLYDLPKATEGISVRLIMNRAYRSKEIQCELRSSSPGPLFTRERHYFSTVQLLQDFFSKGCCQKLEGNPHKSSSLSYVSADDLRLWKELARLPAFSEKWCRKITKAQSLSQVKLIQQLPSMP